MAYGPTGGLGLWPMDPLAVLAYGAEQAPPLIGMEWTCSAPPTIRPMAHSRVHTVFPV